MTRRMLGSWGLLVIAIGCAGCRLSAPIYAFKGLSAEPREEPELSLLFGRVRMDGALTTADAEQIVLNRVDRSPGPRTYYASENVLFRVFQKRAVKDGYFLLIVPPGVYEVVQIESSFLWRTQAFKMRDGARRASRIFVTRPGVYDLGAFAVRPLANIFSGTYVIERTDRTADHLVVLQEAVKGTPWAADVEGAVHDAVAASPDP